MVGSATASQESLGTFEQHKCITLLQVCATCTYNNITSVKYPNGTIITSSLLKRHGNMSKRGIEYNLTFCGTNATGIYSVNGHGDIEGDDEAWVYDFTITENGSDNPEGIVIVVYSLLFFGLLFWWIWTLKENFAHMASNEFKIRQVLLSNSAFLGVVLYMYFCEFFFPKELVLQILRTFIVVSAFTHVLLPIVGFFISLINYYKRSKIHGEE